MQLLTGVKQDQELINVV